MAKTFQDVKALFDAGKIKEAGALARTLPAKEKEQVVRVLPALLPPQKDA